MINVSTQEIAFYSGLRQMSQFSIVFMGNVQECRTEAEILLDRPGESEHLVALVYETTEGWQVRILDEAMAETREQDLAEAASRAAAKLREYVNRRGDNPPAGLTAAGLSFWLMEKRDGTAMGRPVPGRQK